MKDPNENRIGYNETKIGWKPEDWNLKPLGLLGNFSKGKGLSNREKCNIGLPCITYGDIYTKYNSVARRFNSFVSETAAKYSKEIRSGSILFAGTGETLDEIGKCVAYVGNERAYAGGDVIVYILEKENCIYLSYFLNSDHCVRYRRRLGQGHSVVHIYADGLRRLNVFLPPLPEQKKIADILSTWDEAIEQMRKLIDAKKRRKNGLMQQLLTGEKRLQNHRSEKWKTKTMGDLVKPVCRPVPRPSKPYLSTGIRSHCKGTFSRIIEDPRKVSMDTLYQIKAGDLIVNITFAWEGAVAIVSEKDSAGLVSHRFPTFQNNYETCNLEYLKQLIRTRRFVWGLGLISPGGAGRNRVLNKKDFLKMKLEVPNQTVQHEIGQVLATADEELCDLEAELKALEKQKRGLMQKLLTGTIRVKV